MSSTGILFAMSARVSRLFPLLGVRRGTLGGSCGMARRGGKPSAGERTEMSGMVLFPHEARFAGVRPRVPECVLRLMTDDVLLSGACLFQERDALTFQQPGVKGVSVARSADRCLLGTACALKSFVKEGCTCGKMRHARIGEA